MKKMTILIVEDDLPTLEAYKAILLSEFNHVNILTANNEIDAINIIESDIIIDVILTDLVMTTEEGGIKVLEVARIKDPLTIVILITAFSESGLNKKTAYKLGVFDCLSKLSPNPTDDLIFKTESAMYFRNQLLSKVNLEKKISSLSKYFDPKILSGIIEEPELIKPKIKTVTIVFWDIRGFSLLSEKLKAYPDLMENFLKEFFKVSSEVIFENGGVLDKFIGDGVMALFGALRTEENHDAEKNDSISAINSAKMLRSKFNEILLAHEKIWKLKVADGIDIGIGCGINTGDALVGNVGTSFRDHYTAIGACVNLASRIENKAGKGQIKFSATTNARIEDTIKTRYAETLSDIKNINGEFKIYEIDE